MEQRLTESACWDLFLRLFPRGLDDPDIIQRLACGRWERASPDDIADLLGRCLWDVFSNNHEVVTAEGAGVDLGSFRASGGFIADFRSRVQARPAADRGWGYLDFYMGTLGAADAHDFAPFYALIFSRMQALGLDWRYVHPRIYLIDFSEWRDALDDEFEDYDPSERVARDLERQQRAAERDEFRAQLDEDYRRSVEEARAKPPPLVVQSYHRVYGRLPAGWPPSLG